MSKKDIKTNNTENTNQPKQKNLEYSLAELFCQINPVIKSQMAQTIDSWINCVPETCREATRVALKKDIALISKYIDANQTK